MVTVTVQWLSAQWLLQGFITSVVSGVGFLLITLTLEYVKQYCRSQKEHDRAVMLQRLLNGEEVIEWNNERALVPVPRRRSLGRGSVLPQSSILFNAFKQYGGYLGIGKGYYSKRNEFRRVSSSGGSARKNPQDATANSCLTPPEWSNLHLRSVRKFDADIQKALLFGDFDSKEVREGITSRASSNLIKGCQRSKGASKDIPDIKLWSQDSEPSFSNISDSHRDQSRKKIYKDVCRRIVREYPFIVPFLKHEVFEASPHENSSASTVNSAFDILSKVSAKSATELSECVLNSLSLSSKFNGNRDKKRKSKVTASKRKRNHSDILASKSMKSLGLRRETSKKCKTIFPQVEYRSSDSFHFSQRTLPKAKHFQKGMKNMQTKSENLLKAKHDEKIATEANERFKRKRSLTLLSSKERVKNRERRDMAGRLNKENPKKAKLHLGTACEKASVIHKRNGTADSFKAHIEEFGSSVDAQASEFLKQKISSGEVSASAADDATGVDLSPLSNGNTDEKEWPWESASASSVDQERKKRDMKKSEHELKRREILCSRKFRRSRFSSVQLRDDKGLKMKEPRPSSLPPKRNVFNDSQGQKNNRSWKSLSFSIDPQQATSKNRARIVPRNTFSSREETSSVMKRKINNTHRSRTPLATSVTKEPLAASPKKKSPLQKMTLQKKPKNEIVKALPLPDVKKRSQSLCSSNGRYEKQLSKERSVCFNTSDTSKTAGHSKEALTQGIRGQTAKKTNGRNKNEKRNMSEKRKTAPVFKPSKKLNFDGPTKESQKPSGQGHLRFSKDGLSTQQMKHNDSENEADTKLDVSGQTEEFSLDPQTSAGSYSSTEDKEEKNTTVHRDTDSQDEDNDDSEYVTPKKLQDYTAKVSKKILDDALFKIISYHQKPRKQKKKKSSPKDKKHQTSASTGRSPERGNTTGAGKAVPKVKQLQKKKKINPKSTENTRSIPGLPKQNSDRPSTGNADQQKTKVATESVRPPGEEVTLALSKSPSQLGSLLEKNGTKKSGSHGSPEAMPKVVAEDIVTVQKEVQNDPNFVILKKSVLDEVVKSMQGQSSSCQLSAQKKSPSSQLENARSRKMSPDRYNKKDLACGVSSNGRGSQYSDRGAFSLGIQMRSLSNWTAGTSPKLHTATRINRADERFVKRSFSRSPSKNALGKDGEMQNRKFLNGKGTSPSIPPRGIEQKKGTIFTRPKTSEGRITSGAKSGDNKSMAPRDRSPDTDFITRNVRNLQSPRMKMKIQRPREHQQNQDHGGLGNYVKDSLTQPPESLNESPKPIHLFVESTNSPPFLDKPYNPYGVFDRSETSQEHPDKHPRSQTYFLESPRMSEKDLTSVVLSHRGDASLRCSEKSSPDPHVFHKTPLHNNEELDSTGIGSRPVISPTYASGANSDFNDISQNYGTLQRLSPISEDGYWKMKPPLETNNNSPPPSPPPNSLSHESQVIFGSQASFNLDSFQSAIKNLNVEEGSVEQKYFTTDSMKGDVFKNYRTVIIE